MDKLIKYLWSISKSKYWGTLTISFKNGVPCMIEKKESVKLDN